MKSICNLESMCLSDPVSRVAGEFQAEYVLGKLAGSQEINRGAAQRPLNHSATKGRTNGVKRALEQSGKQIHYVFEDTANWDTAQAQKLFEAVFADRQCCGLCCLQQRRHGAFGVVEACKRTASQYQYSAWTPYGGTAA